MQCIVETTKTFDKSFKESDKYTQLIIKSWIIKNLVADPLEHGKPLGYDRFGQLRYMIGDYRLICLIDDYKTIILALYIAHRRKIFLM